MSAVKPVYGYGLRSDPRLHLVDTGDRDRLLCGGRVDFIPIIQPGRHPHAVPDLHRECLTVWESECGAVELVDCPACAGDVQAHDGRVVAHGAWKMRRGPDGEPERYESEQRCDGVGAAVDGGA